MKFVPYLSFGGDCREAFEFYADVLDGELVGMTTHGEMPDDGHGFPGWQDKIINAHLIAEGAELMGADSPPEMGDNTMNGFSVSIQIDDEARGARIFEALSQGGKVIMPFEKTFWARKFGMVTDRFGTPWMINCGMAG